MARTLSRAGVALALLLAAALATASALKIAAPGGESADDVVDTYLDLDYETETTVTALYSPLRLAKGVLSKMTGTGTLTLLKSTAAFVAISTPNALYGYNSTGYVENLTTNTLVGGDSPNAVVITSGPPSNLVSGLRSTFSSINNKAYPNPVDSQLAELTTTASWNNGIALVFNATATTGTYIFKYAFCTSRTSSAISSALDTVTITYGPVGGPFSNVARTSAVSSNTMTAQLRFGITPPEGQDGTAYGLPSTVYKCLASQVATITIATAGTYEFRFSASTNNNLLAASFPQAYLLVDANLTCSTGYTGPDCEDCAVGYSGDPCAPNPTTPPPTTAAPTTPAPTTPAPTTPAPTTPAPTTPAPTTPEPTTPAPTTPEPTTPAPTTPEPTTPAPTTPEPTTPAPTTPEPTTPAPTTPEPTTPAPTTPEPTTPAPTTPEPTTPAPTTPEPTTPEPTTPAPTTPEPTTPEPTTPAPTTPEPTTPEPTTPAPTTPEPTTPEPTTPAPTARPTNGPTDEPTTPPPTETARPTNGPTTPEPTTPAPTTPEPTTPAPTTPEPTTPAPTTPEPTTPAPTTPEPTTPAPTTPAPTTPAPTTPAPTTPAPTTAAPTTTPKPGCCADRVEDAFADGPISLKFVGLRSWGWLNIATKRVLQQPIYALHDHVHFHDDDHLMSEADQLAEAAAAAAEHREIFDRDCDRDCNKLGPEWRDDCDKQVGVDKEDYDCDRRLRVGTARIDYTVGTCVNITISSIDCTRRFSKLHIYVGATPPTTADVTEWGNTFVFNPAVGFFSVCVAPSTPRVPQFVGIHVDANTCLLHRPWWWHDNHSALRV